MVLAPSWVVAMGTVRHDRTTDSFGSGAKRICCCPDLEWRIKRRVAGKVDGRQESQFPRGLCVHLICSTAHCAQKGPQAWVQTLGWGCDVQKWLGTQPWTRASWS